MASQMVVPASRDTLFMRGFSARRDIDEIRDFFSDEGGRCSVEFFKESDDKSKLYVALKFENKDIAKELLNKYDNTEVLGDRITISWFKDLRRARFNANANRNRRSNWSPDRYDKYKGKYYSGSRYMSNRWSSGYGSRSRRYERSYSRSRSRSSSYSRSRSRSTTPRRSHSRSRSSDSYEDRKHRRRHSKKKESHKSDKRKGRDRRSRERSVSMTRESKDRSDEPDDDIIDEKRDKISLEIRSPAKVIHSAVKAVDHESDNDSSTEMSMSEDEIEKVSNQSLEYRTKSVGPEPAKYPDAAPAESGMVARMERQKRQLSREIQPPSNDGMKEQYFSPQQEFDHSPPPPPPPPTKVHSAGRYTTEIYEKQFDRDQEYVQPYKQNIRTMSPGSRSSMQDKEVVPGGGKVEKEYVVIREGREMACGELRNPRQEARYSEERQKLVINTSERVPQKQVADIQSPMEMSHEMGRVQRSAEPEGGGMLGFERKLVHEYDEFKAPARKQDDYDKRPKFVESPITREVRHDMYEEVSQVDRISGPKEQRKVSSADRPEQSSGDYGQPPMERGVVGSDRMRGLRDNGTHLMERGQSVVERGLQAVSSGSGRMMSNRERSPLFDDHESTGSGHSAARSVGPQSYNGGLMKEVEKGALGLPQEKMALVREKKDEIEKSYRQDCETFAAVTKMLISKDTWLEDKLQASLKENLKDIGQRCIHELREFIEALKSESQRG